jgi:hypothetical protein
MDPGPVEQPARGRERAMRATMVCSLSNDLADGDPGYWIKDYRSIYTHTAHYGRQRDRVRRNRKRGATWA